MQLVTKYDIGHTFWVPRVREKLIKEELNWEGETWYRDVPIYVPYVKLKKIVCIDIHIGRHTTVKYGVKTMDEEEQELTQFYMENAITNYSEEEAMAVAEEYAEQNKEYFGN